MRSFRGVTCLALSALGAVSGCVQNTVIANQVDSAGPDAADASVDASLPDVAAEETTHGLSVHGTIESTNESDNAQQAADFETRFMLQVVSGNAPVTDATVTVQSSSANATLVLSDGTYVTTESAYDMLYTFQVTSTEGTLSNLSITGPAFHVFTAPTEGATQPAGSPLTVTWSPSGATSATIESTNLQETPIPDTGSYVIPGSIFQAEAGQTVNDFVRVRRRQSVTDASTGSIVQFELVNQVQIVVTGS